MASDDELFRLHGVSPPRETMAPGSRRPVIVAGAATVLALVGAV